MPLRSPTTCVERFPASLSSSPGRAPWCLIAFCCFNALAFFVGRIFSRWRRLINASRLGRLHQPLHFHIVTDAKGVGLEWVQLRKVEIYDLLFFGSGSVTGLFKGFGVLPQQAETDFWRSRRKPVSSLCGNKDTACPVAHSKTRLQLW